MISWIQITFQRHFRVIFFVLLAVLIVSFVFTIGAAPGIGRGDDRLQARMFFDLNLSSPQDQAKLYGDAGLSITLRAGYQPFDQSQLQEYALQRYAAIHLANELNLPQPSAEEQRAFIAELASFRGENGQFDPSAYTTFRDNLQLAGQYTEADVARVIGDDARVAKIEALLGGPGYYEDNEISMGLARTETAWTTNVATIDYSSYNPVIEPTNDDLQSYFEANSFRYDTAPEVRVSYVDFPAARYFTEVNFTDEDVRAFYEANPARFPNPDAADENGEDELSVSASLSTEEDFLAVKDQVSAALRIERARRLAANAASDLTVELFDASAKTAAAVEAYLVEQNIPVLAADPFNRDTPPGFLGGNYTAVNTAFALSAQRPVSDPVTTSSGAIILIWQESIPSSPSLYINVEEQVRTDYLENEKRQRFVDFGREFQAAVVARLAAGEAFSAALTGAAGEAATSVEVATTRHESFTRRTPPQDFPYAAVNALDQLNEGQLSDMIISGDEGILVHAETKTVPDITRANPRFAELAVQLARLNSTETGNEILRQLIQHELGLDEEDHTGHNH